MKRKIKNQKLENKTTTKKWKSRESREVRMDCFLGVSSVVMLIDGLVGQN